MIEESYQVTGWVEVEPERNAGASAALLRLAVKVILQAVRDASTDTLHGHMAREWLLSADASLYLNCVSIHVDTVREWINAGARIPTRGKRGTNISII